MSARPSRSTAAVSVDKSALPPESLEREAVWQFKAMLSALYPGFDRQALDAVMAALQDRYGSPVAQVDMAVARAREAIARSGDTDR